MQLEDLRRGALVEGILRDQTVTVVDVQWHGSACVELTYKDAAGQAGNTLLYRDDEGRLQIASPGRSWCFDGDGHLFGLAAEAERIRLALSVLKAGRKRGPCCGASMVRCASTPSGSAATPA